MITSKASEASHISPSSNVVESGWRSASADLIFVTLKFTILSLLSSSALVLFIDLKNYLISAISLESSGWSFD